MNSWIKKRISLAVAVPALCLTGGMVSMAAAPANAATTRVHATAALRPLPRGVHQRHIGGVFQSASAFNLVNFNSGLCLGIDGGRIDADAVQWSCNGAANQAWHWGSQWGTSGYYQLINASGACLGIINGSGQSGARIVGWSCLSGHPDQYWTPAGNCSGYSAIFNLNSGLVVGVTGNSFNVGAAVIQYPYQGVCNNQFWA